MQLQLIYVLGIGVLGVLLIVGAILLLGKDESPAEKDKRIKEQIIKEMLDSAVSDEERAGIISMTEEKPQAEAANSAEEDMYGIDENSEDIIDKLIAAHLKDSAFAAAYQKPLKEQSEAEDDELGATQVIDREGLTDIQEVYAADEEEENDREKDTAEEGYTC